MAGVVMEAVKKTVEHITGVGRPSEEDLDDLVRKRVPQAFMFGEDGVVPNNPNWPAIFYRSPVRLLSGLDPAAILEDLFAKHGWGGSWRAVIYNYLHYHSGIHEVLGVAQGNAVVQIGGGGGRTLRVKPGDVLVLPAGTGHQCLTQDSNFMVVGAYPPFGDYDVCRRPQDYARAKASISGVRRPATDPVYGEDGPLVHLWRPVK